jgi:hypothetical protein
MKSFIHPSFSVLILLLFCAGCVSVERANKTAFKQLPVDDTKGSAERAVHISNFGYYFFNVFPIMTGSTRNGEIGTMNWFQDDVTLPDVQRILVNEGKASGTLVTQIQPMRTSTCFFSAIPYIGNTLGIVWYKEIQLSAILVKPENSTGLPQ